MNVQINAYVLLSATIAIPIIIFTIGLVIGYKGAVRDNLAPLVNQVNTNKRMSDEYIGRLENAIKLLIPSEPIKEDEAIVQDIKGDGEKVISEVEAGAETVKDKIEAEVKKVEQIHWGYDPPLKIN